MYKKCHSVLIVIFISLFMLFFSVSCAGTGAPKVSKTEYFEKDISEIAEMITDYNQLKQYFLAIGYGEIETSGDCTFNYRGNEWAINRDAITVFLDNTGNCGGGSNLFCYMLNGDYKEILQSQLEIVMHLSIGNTELSNPEETVTIIANFRVGKPKVFPLRLKTVLPCTNLS